MLVLIMLAIQLTNPKLRKAHIALAQALGVPVYRTPNREYYALAADVRDAKAKQICLSHGYLKIENENIPESWRLEVV